MSSLNILDSLRPNHLVVGVSETTARYESYDGARAFFARPRHIHLVLPLLEEADALFSVGLERELYPFGTEQNDAFHTRALNWHTLTWSIVSIPHEDETAVHSYCKRHYRYLDWGMYTVKYLKKKDEFPFRGDNFRSVRRLNGLVATCG